MIVAQRAPIGTTAAYQASLIRISRPSAASPSWSRSRRLNRSVMLVSLSWMVDRASEACLRLVACPCHTDPN